MTTWNYWYGFGGGLLIAAVWVVAGAQAVALAGVGVGIILVSLVGGVLERKWSSWSGGR